MRSLFLKIFLIFWVTHGGGRRGADLHLGHPAGGDRIALARRHQRCGGALRAIGGGGTGPLRDGGAEQLFPAAGSIVAHTGSAVRRKRAADRGQSRRRSDANWRRMPDRAASRHSRSRAATALAAQRTIGTVGAGVHPGGGDAARAGGDGAAAGAGADGAVGRRHPAFGADLLPADALPDASHPAAAAGHARSCRPAT